MKQYMYYKVFLSYRVEVDENGKMIGKPEMMSGYVPKNYKPTKTETKDITLQQEIQNVEM